VLGDRVQLQQVLVNLVLNASDAMADVTVEPHRLTISSSRDNVGAVRIEVKDCGRGIQPEHVGRLFEAFFSTKSDGLGMGLTISRSIIELHGGTIAALRNDAGPGATMRLMLPAAPVSALPPP
jgi:signal transduction histidine kinase